MLNKTAWKSLLSWHSKSGRHELPWRKNRTPWGVFIAENLLRRTNATAASSIYPKILKDFPTPKHVLQNPEQWKRETSSLGLTSRSDYFIQACEIIIKKYDGVVPTAYSDLLGLPGVGHYKANAIICFAHHKPAYLIDTNTLRIASRITGQEVNQSQHRSLEAQMIIGSAFGTAENMTSKRNYALLDLGRLVCKPRSPNCPECPIQMFCDYGKNKAQEPGNL